MMKKIDSNFKNSKGLWIALSIVIVAIIALKFVYGGNDTIIVKMDKIIIEGQYDEEIKLDDISKIQLSDTLPKIKSRKNGYAAGNVKKGYFETGFRKRVKLILNNNSKPYLFIETLKGNKIYFSESSVKNNALHDEIKTAIKKYNPNHIIF